MKGSLFAIVTSVCAAQHKRTNNATIFTFYVNQVTEFRRSNVIGVDWFVCPNVFSYPQLN